MEVELLRKFIHEYLKCDPAVQSIIRNEIDYASELKNKVDIARLLKEIKDLQKLEQERGIQMVMKVVTHNIN